MCMHAWPQPYTIVHCVRACGVIASRVSPDVTGPIATTIVALFFALGRDEGASGVAAVGARLAPLRRGRGVSASVQSAPRVCCRRSVAPLRGGGRVPRGLRRPALNQASALAPPSTHCSLPTAPVLPWASPPQTLGHDEIVRILMKQCWYRTIMPG